MFADTATIEYSFRSSTQAAQGEPFPARNLNRAKIPLIKILLQDLVPRSCLGMNANPRCNSHKGFY